MIPYAGYDPTEGVGRRSKSVAAYEWFQFGYDTLKIAERMKITEAEALKLINIERSTMLHKPIPYGGRLEG